MLEYADNGASQEVRMANDSKTPESKLDDALQAVRKQLAAKDAELKAARSMIATQAAERGFAAAMDGADAFGPSKALGMRLLKAELSNLKADAEGNATANWQEMQDASPAEIVASFVQANDFMQPIEGAEVTSTPEPRRKVEPGTPTYADGVTPVSPADFSIDEDFAAAGPTPLEGYSGGGDRLDSHGNLRLPEPKGTPFKPDSSSTRMAAAAKLTAADRFEHMSAEELLDGAGPPPRG